MDSFNPEGGFGSQFSFGHYLKIIRKRYRLVIFASLSSFTVLFLPSLYNRLFNPIYSASFSLLVADPLGDRRGSDSTSVFENLASNRSNSNVFTIIQYLKSPLVLAPVATKLNLTPVELTSRISISPPKVSDSGILDVFITGDSYDSLSTEANAIAESFVRIAVDQRQERLKVGLKFLDTELPALLRNRNSIQTKLANFRKLHKISDPTNEAERLQSRISDLDLQLTTLKSTLSYFHDAKKRLSRGELPSSFFNTNVGSSDDVSVNNPTYSSLSKEFEAISLLENKKSSYLPNSPIWLSINASLAKLRKNASRSQEALIDENISLLTTRSRRISEEIALLEDSLDAHAPTLIEYQKLIAELTESESKLNSLKQARDNFRLDLAQKTSPWQLLSEPRVLPFPVSPSISRAFGQSLALSTLFGMLVAVVRDKYDKRFLLPSEVKDSFQAPVLTTIPFFNTLSELRDSSDSALVFFNEIDSPSSLAVNASSRFSFQEAFREVITSLRLSSADRPIKTVTVTSSVPKEGKSLFTLMLAKMLAESDLKVLLVDSDMRKPTLHDRLEIDNLNGFSDLLVDSHSPGSIDISDCIQPVTSVHNLHVITSGQIPPNPVKLLSSEAFKTTYSKLYSLNYDYIIFDSPPTIGLADSTILARHSDALLMLVSVGFVDRSLALEAVQKLEDSQVDLTGIVPICVQSALSSSDSSVSRVYAEYGYYETSSTPSGLPSLSSESVSYAAEPQTLQTRLVGHCRTLLQKLLTWIET